MEYNQEHAPARNIEIVGKIYSLPRCQGRIYATSSMLQCTNVVLIIIGNVGTENVSSMFVHLFGKLSFASSNANWWFPPFSEFPLSSWLLLWLIPSSLSHSEFWWTFIMDLPSGCLKCGIYTAMKSFRILWWSCFGSRSWQCAKLSHHFRIWSPRRSLYTGHICVGGFQSAAC